MFRLCHSLQLFALIFALSFSPVHGQQKPNYGIHEDEPPTGSNIKRFVVSGSSIPIDKKYGDFTTEEKAFVRSFYKKIEPEDEPPFPADGLRAILDAARKAQAKLRVSGDLTMVAKVDAAGEVSEVKTIGSPSDEMTKFMATVLFFTKFKPAVCGGLPCAMEYPFAFSFLAE